MSCAIVDFSTQRQEQREMLRRDRDVVSTLYLPRQAQPLASLARTIQISRSNAIGSNVDAALPKPRRAVPT
jgi:hypothetical protein